MRIANVDDNPLFLRLSGRAYRRGRWYSDLEMLYACLLPYRSLVSFWAVEKRSNRLEQLLMAMSTEELADGIAGAQAVMYRGRAGIFIAVAIVGCLASAGGAMLGYPWGRLAFPTLGLLALGVYGVVTAARSWARGYRDITESLGISRQRRNAKSTGRGDSVEEARRIAIYFLEIELSEMNERR